MTENEVESAMDTRLRWFRVVPLLALCSSVPLGGQVVPVDDAVFQLLRAGEPVGGSVRLRANEALVIG